MKESFREFLLSNQYAIEMTSRISLIVFIVLAFLGPIIPFHGFMFFLILVTFIVLIVSVRLEYHVGNLHEKEFISDIKDLKEKILANLAEEDECKKCKDCPEKEDCPILNCEKDEQSSRTN